MGTKSYFDERNKKNMAAIYTYVDKLPSFCFDFFVSLENRTSSLTRLNYAMDLTIFFDYLAKRKFNVLTTEITLADLNKVTATDIDAFLSYLSYYMFEGEEHKNGEKGKARKLASVRSFFKFLFNRDKIIANVASKVETPKLHNKAIIRLETDEVNKLLDQADNPYLLSRQQQLFNKHTKLRDIALLSLLLGTGIRISECVGLNIEDIDFKSNAFKVTRKGGNQAILYFSDEVATALNNYMETRIVDPNISKDEKALFISLQNKRMSVRAIEILVKKYSQAVTPLKKITPHKLRSTYGTNLYKETKDIYIVAEVLGHKDVNTTKRHYAAISEDIKKEAADKVKLRND